MCVVSPTLRPEFLRAPDSRAISLSPWGLWPWAQVKPGSFSYSGRKSVGAPMFATGASLAPTRTPLVWTPGLAVSTPSICLI